MINPCSCTKVFWGIETSECNPIAWSIRPFFKYYSLFLSVKVLFRILFCVGRFFFNLNTGGGMIPNQQATKGKGYKVTIRRRRLDVRGHKIYLS